MNPRSRKALSTALFLACFGAAPLAARDMESFPVVKLQTLDKITARTMTFEASVGNTVKFGSLYIKIQSCRKATPVEQPESAAFLQIWEVKHGEEEEPGENTPEKEVKKDSSQWIFSGWMFASSPALSHMDHPIYDVWVLDCLDKKDGRKKEEVPPPAPAAAEPAPATPDVSPATAPLTGEPENKNIEEELSPLGD